jgi:hypothetical protein
VSFLLLYYVLRIDRIDLRMAASLFARATPKYRSTLCKLYQIAFVLCAAGIANRTNMVCEVVLRSEYVDFQVVAEEIAEAGSPAVVENLLNHRGGEMEIVYKRRREIAQMGRGIKVE